MFPLSPLGRLHFSIIKAIDLPNGVESIGEQAFRECTSLTAVSFPDGLTSIGSGAFFYCTSLADVYYPESLTSVGELAFYGYTLVLPKIVLSDGKNMHMREHII